MNPAVYISVWNAHLFTNVSDVIIQPITSSTKTLSFVSSVHWKDAEHVLPFTLVLNVTWIQDMVSMLKTPPFVIHVTEVVYVKDIIFLGMEFPALPSAEMVGSCWMKNVMMGIMTIMMAVPEIVK